MWPSGGFFKKGVRAGHSEGVMWTDLGMTDREGAGHGKCVRTAS